jgi:hypothetical protein
MRTSKRKRGRPSKPVMIGPPEWTPLEHAFSRISKCLDSHTLAARDLYNGLLTGRLPSAIRAFDKCGVEVKTGPIDPQHWQQYDFLESRPEYGWRLVLKDSVSRYSESLYCEVHYFVSSAALDHLYPTAASPGTVQSTQISESPGFPRRDTRGAKSEINWEEVLIEAADLMVRNRYRRLVDLKEAIHARFREQWPQGSVEDSTLSRHLSELFNRLKLGLGD